MADVERDLLKSVKAHLRITWDSQDEEIKEMIDEAKGYIVATCGETDFNIGIGFTLLKNYCRYYWFGNASMFEMNYRSLILKLQIWNGRRKKG